MKKQHEVSRIKLPEDPLLTKSETADLLRMSLRTIERLASAGKLTKIKIGGCVRFRLSVVRRIMGIESNLVQP
jgi:excisionase family DNA binding protein